MYLMQVALFVLYYFNYCYGASTRVWHKNCNKQGFTCINGNKTLIYECPVRSKEYHIYVNELNGPTNSESLIIRNCKTLTILLRCTTYKHEWKIKYLQVSNIGRLKIQTMPNYHSQLPPKVVFEDIKFIEKIPNYSFSQVDKRRRNARCIVRTQDFNSVYFRNVTINTVNTHAFYMPNKFGNVTFSDVRINKMDIAAVTVNLAEDAVFLLDKSVVQALKPFSFRIVGREATFSETKFASIPPSGINATTETFNFINNSVKTLYSRALSILASNVLILNNRFDSLKAGAFEQIGPRIFGKPKFTYDFSRNDINFMDAGCLHPDLIAHENVSSEISFNGNRLSCSCDKLDWLFSTLEHGNITAPIAEFYKMVFDEKNENICSNSCNLPLMATRGMFKNGNCIQNATLQWLCDNKDSNTTVITSFPSSGVHRYTTSSIRASTIPPAKSNSTVVSFSEYSITSSTQIPTVNLSNETTSSAFWTPKFSTHHRNLTTSTVRLPILRSTKYRPPNTFVLNTTNTTIKYKQTITSISENNVTISNSDATSSAFPKKESEIKIIAFGASTLSHVTTKLQIPDSLQLVNSAENYFVCFLLLASSTLCIVINT